MLCRNRWGGLEQEGFGIVFIEAASCGVPQVAGDSGGAAEAVADGETGSWSATPRTSRRSPTRSRAARRRRAPGHDGDAVPRARLDRVLLRRARPPARRDARCLRLTSPRDRRALATNRAWRHGASIDRTGAAPRRGDRPGEHRRHACLRATATAAPCSRRCAMGRGDHGDGVVRGRSRRVPLGVLERGATQPRRADLGDPALPAARRPDAAARSGDDAVDAVLQSPPRRHRRSPAERPPTARPARRWPSGARADVRARSERAVGGVSTADSPRATEAPAVARDASKGRCRTIDRPSTRMKSMAETATESITIERTPSVSGRSRSTSRTTRVGARHQGGHDPRDRRRGPPAEVEFRASALGRSTHYTLSTTTRNAPASSGWKMLRGDIQRSIDGAFTFDGDSTAAPTCVRPGDRPRRAAARVRQAARRGAHPQHRARAQGPRRGVTGGRRAAGPPDRDRRRRHEGARRRARPVGRGRRRGRAADAARRRQPRPADRRARRLSPIARRRGQRRRRRPRPRDARGCAAGGPEPRRGRRLRGRPAARRAARARSTSTATPPARRSPSGSSARRAARRHDAGHARHRHRRGHGRQRALQRGSTGSPGEFGHMVVDPDGPPCPCGARVLGALRVGVRSGDARTEAAAGGRLHEVVRHAGGDPEAVRGEHVQAAAREGDAEALAVIDDFARWVALGLSNLTNADRPGDVRARRGAGRRRRSLHRADHEVVRAVVVPGPPPPAAADRVRRPWGAALPGAVGAARAPERSITR